MGAQTPMMGLVAALLLSAAEPPAAEVRSVLVSVTDEKGAPVQGLVPEEVAVLENGVARELTRIEPDERPLMLVVLVDTSEAVSSALRLNVVEALTSFLNRLPSGSRYALWTTGDRPTKLVDFSDDPSAAQKALKRVIPQGGNTLLDALVEATGDLRSHEGARTAVLVVTGLDTEFSGRERHQVVEQAAKNASLFIAVQYEAGPVTFEERQAYDFVLGSLTKRTGGLHETLLSPMGVAAALQKASADLRGRYRLSYATLAGGKPPKLEVKVARPGVRVRVATPQPRNH